MPHMLINVGGREDVRLSACGCTSGYVCMGASMYLNVCVRECNLLNVWVFVNKLLNNAIPETPLRRNW